GPVVKLGDVRRKSANSLAFQHRPQELKFVTPSSVAYGALPVTFPGGRPEWRHGFEFEARVCARHYPSRIETLPIGRQIPLDESAEQAIVAFELQRDAHRHSPQTPDKFPAQRVEVRHQTMLLQHFSSIASGVATGGRHGARGVSVLVFLECPRHDAERSANGARVAIHEEIDISAGTMRWNRLVDEDVPGIAFVSKGNGDQVYFRAFLAVSADDFFGAVGASVRHHKDFELAFGVRRED